MKKTIGFLIMAGHLDIEWYQPLRSYRFWTAETLDRLRASAKGSFPTYTLDGQVFPLEEYLEIAPEAEADMRRLIAEGRLAVGPFYTQFDEWIPSAENMIRNCLWGDRRAKSFGKKMIAGYLPDNFGHPVQIPQILHDFGMDSLLFMRGMPEIAGGHPDEFIYRGIDGSEILSSHFREGYGGAFDLNSSRSESLQPREVPYYPDMLSFEHHVELSILDSSERVADSMIENVRKRADRYPSRVVPLVAGGDHMPPQIGLDEALAIANEKCPDIEFRSGSAQEYIDLMRENTPEDARVFDMELTGSRWQHILLGALSTRSYLKRMNFGCEALLERYAEPLAALAEMRGVPVRRTYLAEAWRNMLINSAHDSIHGSSVDEVHTEMEARFSAARQDAAGVIHQALASLSARSEKDGRRVTAWPGAKSDGAQTLDVWLNIGDSPVVMRGADGEILPTQILPREETERNGRGEVRNDMYPGRDMRRVLFRAPLPFGRISEFRVGEGSAENYEMPAGDTFIENGLVRVDVRGGLIDLTDLRTGKLYRGLNLLHEDADTGDDWDWSNSWIPGAEVLSNASAWTAKLTEHGAVRSTITMTGSMRVPECLHGDLRSVETVEMPVKFEVSLLRDTPRVDVRCTIDNTARDHRVRLQVPTSVQTKEILSQGQLCVLRRPVARELQDETWFQPPTQLMPMREWAAAASPEGGLAVALKGMYDYEAVNDPLTRETTLYFTLVRGIGLMGRLNMPQRKRDASMAVPVPGAQCLGEQVLEWSYVPFNAEDGETLGFIPQTEEFLFPPVTHAVRTIDQPAAEPMEAPLYAWDEPNVRFSAFKQAEDGEGYVLRVYEDRGEDTVLGLRLNGFGHVFASDMNESIGEELPVENGCVRVHAAPYKAVTLLLRK